MTRRIWLLCLILHLSIEITAEEIPITIPEQNRSEIIRFSHQFHLMDIALECDDCHASAATSDLSGDNLLPMENLCADCHGEEVGDPMKCVKCHTGAPVGFENPERVIDFPHQFHVSKQGLDCRDCHQGMEKTDYANRHNWPKMAECLTCHQDQNAPADCETCHPKVEVMRPQSHQVNWIHEHRQPSRSGLMPCARCHQDAWCEDCHAGGSLTNLEGPADRMASGGSQNRGRVGQVLQRQHDLNYRFTHPLDAAGKERECASCHETSFCIDCHRVEEDERRFKPIWHGPVPTDSRPWILAGIGSGGGRHGEWARRDIEQCVACHDVEGEDPSCMQCHTDFDGVRGTDPRTHSSGFRGQAGNGEFHADEHDLCYACHVNSRTPGVGFCGYCHS